MLRSRPPYPIFQVLDTKKHVLHGIEAIKWVCRAAPPKKWHFLAKNGLKLPILGKKAVFLGLGAQFSTPLPYFFGA